MGAFEAEGLYPDAPKRIFDQICGSWSLSEEERHGLHQRVLEIESIEGYLDVGRIYRALHSLFYDAGPERADSWVHRPNKRFDGVPAIRHMIDHPGGIAEVRSYVLGALYGEW